MKKNTKILLGCLSLFLVIYAIKITSVSVNIDNSPKESIAELVIDENPRVVDEGEDYITIQRDFKADEFTSADDYGMSLYMWPWFSIRNITKNGTYTNKNLVASSDDFNTETTHAYNVSYSATTSIENIKSIGAAEFNTKIGVSTSDTVSVSKQFTTTCPTTYNGKKVKSCTVTYYPKYQKYKFDEYFLEAKKTTGYAKVLVGFTQEITYRYA